MSLPPVASAPFSHASASVRKTMLLVMAALLPATGFGLYLYGWPAIFLFLVTIASAVAAEAMSLRLANKPLRPFLTDGSAVLAGWLLALTLPPWAPWWIGAAGAAIAIVIGKHVFGGLGQNLFNPAMVARVALLISFPLEMTTFLEPHPLLSTAAPSLLEGVAISFLGGLNLDAVSSASLLGHVKTGLTAGTGVSASLANFGHGLRDQLIGVVPGSLGETSAALLLAGGLFLLAMRTITWRIPVAFLGSLALAAAAAHGLAPERYAEPLVHLLSGGAVMAAFFIATDLVTSPVTARGQLLFGAGCGVLTFVIRAWANYPEGIGFAVLLMNAVTPLIDRYIRPRIYGRTRSGSPLPVDPKFARGDHG